MSEDLFERYLRGALSEAERRELKRLLATEDGARSFVAFLQEWSLMADVSCQMASAAAPATPARAHVKTTVSLSRGRLRPKTRPLRTERTWAGWAAALAASILALAAAVLFRGNDRQEVVRRDQDRVAGQGSVKEPAPTAVQTAAKGSGGESTPAHAPAPTPGPAPKPVVVAQTAPAPAVAPAAPPSPDSAAVQPLAAAPLPAEAQPGAGPKPAAASTAPAGAPAVQKPPAPFARLERAAGVVQILAGDAASPAKAGEGLLAGQGLRTSGPAGRAVVRFTDGTRVELGADTLVRTMSDGGAAPAAPTGRGRQVALAAGVVTAEVPRQPPGRSMVFTTPHAEATVLGTRLTITVTADATRLDVKEGRVRFTRLSDGASVEVKTGTYAVSNDGSTLAAKPIAEERPPLLADDFQEPNATAARWRIEKGEFPIATAGRVDVTLTPRPGDPAAWAQGSGVHTRASFALPLRVSVDVEVTQRQDDLIGVVLFQPSPEKANDKNSFFVELRGGAYQLVAGAEMMSSVAAAGEWPRRERWTVDVTADEVRMAVDGREVLRARHGRRVVEAYHIALHAQAKFNAPSEAHVRFDNVRVEPLPR